jgi:hypothetical protein
MLKGVLWQDVTGGRQCCVVCLPCFLYQLHKMCTACCEVMAVTALAAVCADGWLGAAGTAPNQHAIFFAVGKRLAHIVCLLQGWRMFNKGSLSIYWWLTSS